MLGAGSNLADSEIRKHHIALAQTDSLVRDPTSPPSTLATSVSQVGINVNQARLLFWTSPPPPASTPNLCQTDFHQLSDQKITLALCSVLLSGVNDSPTEEASQARELLGHPKLAMTTKSGSSADIFTTGITIDLTSPSLSGSSTDPMETIPLILTPPVSIPSFPPVSIIDPSVNPRSSLLSFLHPTPHKASYPPAITSTGPSPSPSNLPANSNTTTPVSAPPLAKLCDTTPLFFIDASGNTTSNPCSNYPDPLETSAMESISVVHAPEAPNTIIFNIPRRYQIRSFGNNLGASTLICPVA
ncbi:hypothetical protein H4Q26_014634 [Puccinia striiformis f. sp. tritici PST-130]|nr:hypothetical protein H4Q26_014634 [Puccinia striiformis f. sp. tritici PST-130]